MHRNQSAALIAALLLPMIGCETLRHPAFSKPTPLPTPHYVDESTENSLLQDGQPIAKSEENG